LRNFIVAEQTVEVVDAPIKLFLKRDHPRTGAVMNFAGVSSRVLLGECVQLPPKFQRKHGCKREAFQICAGELVEALPSVTRGRAFPASVALVVAHLLEPEAGGRTIEEAEQG